MEKGSDFYWKTIRIIIVDNAAFYGGSVKLTPHDKGILFVNIYFRHLVAW